MRAGGIILVLTALVAFTVSYALGVTVGIWAQVAFIPLTFIGSFWVGLRLL